MNKIFLISLFFIYFCLGVNYVSAEENCLKYNENLKLNDGYGNGKKNAVIELQMVLKKSGYFITEPTGYFGAVTFKAVKAYQSKNKIIATGFVGVLTRSSLKKNQCTEEPIMVCDYAAPPIGCSYVKAEKYNSISNCGMILYCPDEKVKIKKCPDEKIIDKMPIMCIKAPCISPLTSYYVYLGSRYDIEDFDANWVENNCKVKETAVY